MPASIFKAYDIRGIVGDTLTPAIAREIGRAIGSEAYERGQQSIIVARDGRLSGPKIIENLIKGLRETGRDVIDIGMVPTPVLYFATQYLNTGSGIMVTGSHNPPDYNGFKMVLRNETLSGEAIQGLRKRIEAGNFLSGDGGLESVDVVNDYLERITSDINLARPMKVILDCGNGVGGSVAPRLLQALGCELTELYCEVDGNFPNHHPDPSDPKNLLDLIKAVKEQGADVGLALDGDGDRLGVIDADGNVIWADRQMMLYAKDVLSRNAGAMIIYDIKCTNNLGTVIQQAGGTPLMWKTGHSFIKAKLAETGALLAGEMSGHIFFKERWFGFDDALYTAARLLEILAADKRTSTEIFASLPSAVSTPELKADTTEGGQFTFIEKFVAQASFEGAVLTTIDGLRADFEDGWGLVRASNTTPCLVIRFEAKTPQA
ncbi:MAG: phosphomannomutase/phosphoglucomutase, partial [Gammaproteobacteria bacterium]|nr:phosphomannomutase/phosphoglucomutase [Gammaproteobacteria bacterium]